jgi:hypothetical protein
MPEGPAIACRAFVFSVFKKSGFQGVAAFYPQCFIA